MDLIKGLMYFVRYLSMFEHVLGGEGVIALWLEGLPNLIMF